MAAARWAAGDPPARMTRASVGGPAAAEAYPRGVLVNFRQLKISTLKRYARRFNVQVHPNATASELAAAVARHYDASLQPREEEVVENFSKYCAARSTHDTVAIPAARATRARRAQQTNPRGMQAPYYMQQEAEEGFAPGLADDLPPPGRRGGPMAEQLVPPGAMGAMARRQRERGPEHGVEEEDDDGLGAERYCLCDRVSFGEMIGCDADDCALGGGWFHISCVGLTAASMPADGQQWFCPMCRTPGLPHLHKSSSVAAGRHNIGDMIALALAATEHRQATYRGICQYIEHAFEGMLGDGRDGRNSAVWKTSVRKLLLNSGRFRRIDDAGEVYTFA